MSYSKKQGSAFPQLLDLESSSLSLSNHDDDDEGGGGGGGGGGVE